MEMYQEFLTAALHLADGFQLTEAKLIVYVVISFLVVLWCRFKWNNRHIEKLAAKMKGPPAYPIIGSGFQFIGSPQQVVEKLYKLFSDYGPEPFKLWLGTKFVVAIIKPEDIQIILNNSKALKKPFVYNFYKSLLGEGLVLAPVEKWRKHRRIITPVFNAKLLDQFFPVFLEKYQNLIEILQKEVGKTEPFDLWDCMASTSLEIILQNAMGYNMDTQQSSDSEFIEASTKALELNSVRVFKPWLYPDIIFSIFERLTGLKKLNEKVFKIPNLMIKERKLFYAQKKMEKKENIIDVTDGEKKPLKVFLDILLELNAAGADFTDEDIKDEVVTMMGAGSETNAATNCFCLLLLAMHPDIQNKVYEEIYFVFGDSDEPITIEDTTKLVYLEQVLMETLRLYPIIPFFSRELEDDVKITNYTLPKKTLCIIPPIATHHLPELYPNPWSFNPDNFDPINVAKRHKYSFIAFSGGSRGCLGSKYAMLSMKVLIALFLRNFSVHTDMKLPDIKLKFAMLVRNVNGYPVTIRPRNRRPTYK